MLAPAAIALLGTSGALVVVGACLPLFVGLRARALRRLATVNPVPDGGFRALRSVPDFAPLPLATVENVARRLSELRLPAGTVVIREGDPGDCCYVVAGGPPRRELRSRGPADRCGGRARSARSPCCATSCGPRP